MAKLTDLNIVVLTGDEDNITFKTPVSVSKDGLFTTTLPADAAAKLETYGPELAVNRAGRAGFFSDKTLDGLRKNIENHVKECISKTLVEDKLIIKYRVTTKCSYALDDDGEIIPNGYWIKSEARRTEQYATNWREGNANVPTNGNLPGVSVFAKVLHKRVYAYKSGRTIEKLEPYRPQVSGGRGKSIDWINSLCNIRATEFWDDEKDYRHMPEVDATDENAALFVKLFQFIFKANELFKDLNNPEYFLEMAAKNMPLAIEK